MTQLATTERRLDDVRLPLDILTGGLALALWVASGSLVLAIANGLGDHAVRRLSVGLLLVCASAAMLWRRDVVASVLRQRSWLVLLLAGGELTAAIVDGVIGGAYVAFSLTSVGVAVVAARARTVWLCVALLEVGYVLAVVAEGSLASLGEQGELGGVLGAMIGYPVAALLFLGLRRRFARFIDAVDMTLRDIRLGGSAFTPALGRAIGGNLAAPPAAPAPRLTPKERFVVERLAAGSAAKEIAHQSGVSLATVRTQISSAKRKTGARTLRELASHSSRPEWSQSGGSDGD